MAFQLLKAALMGLIQGIAEWLPISSGGHLLLLNEFLPLQGSDSFFQLFDVLIQLGSILAVVVLYFRRLNPFAPSKSRQEKQTTWSLWFKIIVAVIPSGVIGVLLDDLIEEKLNGLPVIAAALIIYGIIFLFLDRLERGKHARRIQNAEEIDYKTAFLVGCFQILALIPGTSRSGSTIIGALLLGLARPAAVEFSFFMAIPTMLGASLLKCAKFVMNGGTLAGGEIAAIVMGFAVAFAISLAVIRVLVRYIRTHTFRAFGIYRILLGLAVIAWLILK
ncbi:MAG: undecaprenyl-diphosphate phosphatase [Clostridia bacterium]|nr:undecaprenyl-diphosphate phosphatase [Clostridia bacterium]